MTHSTRDHDTDAAKAARLLGVPPDAPADVLRRAWRAAARREHPDHGGTPERFIAVTAAYELLHARTTDDPRTGPPPAPAVHDPPATTTAPDLSPPPHRRPRTPILGLGDTAALIALIALAATIAGLATAATPALTTAAAIAAAVPFARYAARALRRRARTTHRPQT